MGSWGTAAWDNDSAADWFAELFDATFLAKHIEQTLEGEVDEESQDEIRAAAYVVVALGRVYVWPVDDLDPVLMLAIEKLNAIKALELNQEYPKFLAAIDEELAILKSRLKPPASSP